MKTLNLMMDLHDREMALHVLQFSKDKGEHEVSGIDTNKEVGVFFTKFID